MGMEEGRSRKLRSLEAGVRIAVFIFHSGVRLFGIRLERAEDQQRNIEEKEEEKKGTKKVEDGVLAAKGGG